MAEQTAYSTERLDQHGIVAGICREIELVEWVATVSGEDGCKVSVGNAVLQMVMNGLSSAQFVKTSVYCFRSSTGGDAVDIVPVRT